MSLIIRKPTSDELLLIDFLIRKANISMNDNWKHVLKVKSLSDGGMGSLAIYPFGIYIEDRVFGKQVSDFEFVDEDGVTVSAALYVDNEGSVMELDMWKVDFSRLIRFPKVSCFKLHPDENGEC